MLLTNHQGLPLARTTVPPGQPGHLQLSKDARGLHFDAQLDRADPDARTLMAKLRGGLLDQASFAFRVIRQTWSDDRTQRTIEEVSLDRGDVSIVNYGANPTTSVDARSRRPGTGDLGLYQARLRAIKIRRHPAVFIGVAPNGTMGTISQSSRAERYPGQFRLLEMATIGLMSHQTGVILAEVGFLLILFAGIWLVAAQIPAFKMPTMRNIVAGIALAVAGLLLIIATRWGHFGGPS